MRFAGGPQMARFMGDSPRYDQLSDIHNEARSVNRQMNHEAEGFVASAGLDAMAKVKSATHNARAIVAGAEADAAASQAQGMSGMMSGIAGGIGNISFGGGSTGSGSSPAFGSMPGTPVSTDYMNRLTSFYGA